MCVCFRKPLSGVCHALVDLLELPWPTDRSNIGKHRQLPSVFLLESPMDYEEAILRMTEMT